MTKTCALPCFRIAFDPSPREGKSFLRDFPSYKGESSKKEGQSPRIFASDDRPERPISLFSYRSSSPYDPCRASFALDSVFPNGCRPAAFCGDPCGPASPAIV